MSMVSIGRRNFVHPHEYRLKWRRADRQGRKREVRPFAGKFPSLGRVARVIVVSPGK